MLAFIVHTWLANGMYPTKGALLTHSRESTCGESTAHEAAWPPLVFKGHQETQWKLTVLVDGQGMQGQCWLCKWLRGVEVSAAESAPHSVICDQRYSMPPSTDKCAASPLTHHAPPPHMHICCLTPLQDEWTAEEEEQLRGGIAEHAASGDRSKPWTKIGRQLKRHPDSVSNHYLTLQRRDKRDGTGEGPGGSWGGSWSRWSGGQGAGSSCTEWQGRNSLSSSTLCRWFADNLGCSSRYLWCDQHTL